MKRGSRNSIKNVWGGRKPYQGEWPVRVDLKLVDEPDEWVQSCCVLCSNGCALDIGVKEGKIVGVRGRGEDRVNRGRLGPKGLHGWVANDSPDRLTYPLIRDGDDFRKASWHEAMDLVVKQARKVRDEYTGDAVGFYTTGQLLLEEYYTLSIIAQGGLGTSNIDGNTRLCTATAAQALCETFGTDGQPGSYTDLDVTDCLFLVGHNMAETQTVLWARVLDRLKGRSPPKLIVVDPRKTPTAARADIHLAPKLGTNVALLNGLLHLLIEAGHVDSDFIDRHTVGFQRLAEVVSAYTPERVRKITGVPKTRLREAAKVLGTTLTLVSTVLQGVYQSNQATAAACQVNNINLLRGMIGKPGCTVFQMNGQPTAQNTRETGCDGEFPAFRNQENPAHMEDLARRWNIDPLILPYWHLHAHAMEIFRRAETGSIKLLWVVGTNPAVSLPELHRVRNILAKDELFVVVQDAFLTETARLADVVLPAAIWGEKTGTATNTDRTAHLSFKAVDPPGEARPDLDIFLDFARRMGFEDKDGEPLVKWEDTEGAFEHWKECSRGWPCDYSGLTYAKLTGGSGVQWPCNDEHPDGAERLYTDFVFNTSADVCRTYGHDLETGAAITAEQYRAEDPAGRAVLKSAEYHPPVEEPDDDYPFWLTTGRVVYHFHTRTKTGRSPELSEAAPEVFAQMHTHDVKRLGLKPGDEVEITSRRGAVRARVQVGNIGRGHVFLPFHYGYWDADGDEHARAANELTVTGWDPVSKQPYFKFAAVSVQKVAPKALGARVADLAARVGDRIGEFADRMMSTGHVERSRVADGLGLLSGSHAEFAEACRGVMATHFEESEIQAGLTRLAEFSREAVSALEPHASRYGAHNAEQPVKLRETLFPAARPGSFGLLRDLQNLVLLATESQGAVTSLIRAAHELRDEALLDTCRHLKEQTKRQLAWLQTQVKHRSAHTLVVPQ